MSSINTITKENQIKLLIKHLSVLLTGDEHHEAAFRIHNKQLETVGDISFQIDFDFAAWKSLKKLDEDKNSISKLITIFDYASQIHEKEINTSTLPTISKRDDKWKVKIAKCIIIKTSCHLFIERNGFIEETLKEICRNQCYGDYRLLDNINIAIQGANEEVGTKQKNRKVNISDLRVKILKKIIDNFLKNNENIRKEEKDAFTILLTTKSSDLAENKILCGCVLNDRGRKEETMTSEDIYDEYASNMRMMFEHKYGVRNITENPNWKEKIAKLGHAAVTFQMIQNTPQKTVSLAAKHHVIKDAAFVIYNGARIKSILRRFDAEVEQKLHPNLPHINDIEFSTLKLNEEWELIFAFLSQYPLLTESSLNGLRERRLNLHKIYEFLVQFSTTFSTYYSRTKIITEPKNHLFVTLHARIYLLKAIDIVLHNALRLLNIETVNQM